MPIDESLPFRPVRIAILTVSDSRSAANDKSGDKLEELLTAAGHILADRAIVRDDRDQIVSRLHNWIDDPEIDVVITTGGTGCAPTDLTPEATRSVLTREIPGIAEAIRADGLANGVAGAMLSRATAGLAGRCIVVNLPGSTGGVRDGLRVIAPILGHLVEQLRGGDH